jgi:integrase
MDRAWARAGIRRDAFNGQPYKAFRKGFKSELLKALLIREDAIDFLQGHTIGNGSSRHRYITADALGLTEAVKQIPKLGTSPSNVVALPHAH